MARAHREVTDQATKEDHNSRRLVRWTPAELLDLAEKEALLMKKGVKFMNEALFPLCPGRSLEAIKGQRRKEAYKELVKAELAKLVTEGLCIAGDEGEGASVEGEEGRGEGQGPSRSGPASGTLDTTQRLLNQRIEPERQNDRQNPLLGTEGRATGLAHLRRDALREGQRQIDMTDSQPEGEEHLTPNVAELLQGAEGEVEDGESSCIWTQDVATQEELDEFIGKSTMTIAQRKKAKYEHCRILKGQMELYKDIIGNVWDHEEETGVGADRKVIDDWVREQLLKWVRWEGNPKPKPVRQPDKKQPFISKKKEKARLRQLTQSFYERSPSRCINAVLSGNLEVTQVIPKKELEEYWASIFSRKPEGVVKVDTINRPADTSYSSPISLDEVKEGLRNLKDNSPGPDGLKKSDVAKIPVQVLHAMLLIFQGSSYTPKFLRLGNVTLVPKNAKPENPGQYRPITVTSQLLRLYHGILAKRLVRLPLSKRQKAFLPRDGIAENAFIIEHLIKGARARREDLFLVFMDVAKAFDSLAHTSLLQAAERIGIPASLREYIALVYEEAEIQFKGGEKKIKQTMGIRQGCQKSAPLFDASLDMCYEKLDPRIGYRVPDPAAPQELCSITQKMRPGGYDITEALFADDGVTVAATRIGSVKNTLLAVRELGKCGMKMNPKKCATLAIRANGRLKKSYVDPTPYLTIDGEVVPALKLGETYKYLGLKIGANGYDIREITKKLIVQLDRLSEASFKPQQRLHALKVNVIGGMLHTLVLVHVSLKTLLNIDRTIRRYVRKWLHLQSDTPTAMFHANTADGGLGIPSMVTRIPRLRRARLVKMTTSDDPLIKIMVSSGTGEAAVRLASGIKRLGEVQITNKQSERRAWREELISKTDGRGLQYHDGFGDGWILDPLFPAKGGEFIKALRVRCNAMKTPARAARGDRGDPTCRLDKQTANATHISQICQVTHGLRVKRHDGIVKMVRAGLQRVGFTVQLEPKIAIEGTFVKPDIVAWKKDKGFIIDPIICGDNCDPEERYRQKVTTYDKEAVRKYVKDEALRVSGANVKEVEVHGFAINFRGGWSTSTQKLLSRLGLGASLKHFISIRTLTTTWTIIQTYDRVSLGYRK